MPLVHVRTIYERARLGGYAVGGFDAEHIDMIKAIVDAAEECHSPVIVFLWEADIEVAGKGYLEAIVKQAAMDASVPVAIHLDHGTSLKSCLNAIMSGHTGVMVDYAHLDFDDNVAKTNRVVEICHLLDAWVEAELGTVPRTFESEGQYAEEKILTDPVLAAKFVELTGIDLLAVSIGEESGLYTSETGFDIERLRDIRNRTDTYLIMHGGSGTPPDQIEQVVENGIVGIRFATEIRIAFFDTMEKVRAKLGHDFPDSRKMQQPAREAVKSLVKERMRQMGSVGQACTDGLCPPILDYGRENTKPLQQQDELDRIVDLVIKSISN
jgi:ketose-bisphosphate aldolase